MTKQKGMEAVGNNNNNDKKLFLKNRRNLKGYKLLQIKCMNRAGTGEFPPHQGGELIVLFQSYQPWKHVRVQSAAGCSGSEGRTWSRSSCIRKTELNFFVVCELAMEQLGGYHGGVSREPA